MPMSPREPARPWQAVQGEVGWACPGPLRIPGVRASLLAASLSHAVEGTAAGWPASIFSSSHWSELPLVPEASRPFLRARGGS